MRQRPSSGMSLLSQGEWMEGGREQEVRLEGRSTVRLASARATGGREGFHQSFDHYAQLLRPADITTEVHASSPIRMHWNLILELQLFKSISPLLSVTVSCRLSHSFNRCRTRLALLSVHSVHCRGSPRIHSHGYWLPDRTCMRRDTNTGKSAPPLRWPKLDTDRVQAFACMCGEWTWKIVWWWELRG